MNATNTSPAARINANKGEVEISIRGMRHRQMISTVRCVTEADRFNPNGPRHTLAEVRDIAEARARRFGHRLVYVFATPNVISSKPFAGPKVVEIESGDVVVYVDQEGAEHTLRLSKPRWNDTAVLEVIAGPYAA